VSPGLPWGLTCGTDYPQVTVRDRSSAGLMARQWPGDPNFTCADPRAVLLPVLLDSCIPRAVAAVSKLAKRPRSGLALTRRTRPRQSSSEEDTASLEGSGYEVSDQPERRSGGMPGYP
jgi:hypothetical protein